MKSLHILWVAARLVIFLSVVGSLVGRYWISELSVSSTSFRLLLRNGSSGVAFEFDENVQQNTGLRVNTYDLADSPDFLDPWPRYWAFRKQSVVLIPHWLVILLLILPRFVCHNFSLPKKTQQRVRVNRARRLLLPLRNNERKNARRYDGDDSGNRPLRR